MRGWGPNCCHNKSLAAVSGTALGILAIERSAFAAGSDALGIARTQGPRLDRAYLARFAPALGVEDLVDRLLHEA